MNKRVLEDISNMGLAVEIVLNPISKEHILGCDREEEIIEMVENERDLCWAVEVDRANGTCDAEDHYFREGSEGDIEEFFVHGMLSQMDPALVAYCDKIAAQGGPTHMPDDPGLSHALPIVQLGTSTRASSDSAMSSQRPIFKATRI
ncbi:hypothetical protein V6N13_069563 [Hibiscus sabdariffa]